MPTTMSSQQPPRIVLLTASTPQLPSYIEGMVYVHAQCILNDGTIATFLPPLSHDRMRSYWEGLVEQVTRRERHIVVTLSPIAERTVVDDITLPVFEADSCDYVKPPTITIDDTQYEISGMISLYKDQTETVAHRGEVVKLLTSPYHRRKGLARVLMREVERLARQDGRWNLLLDTEAGSPAEGVYPKLGYSRIGVMRQHSVSPRGGYGDLVLLDKDLRISKEL